MAIDSILRYTAFSYRILVVNNYEKSFELNFNNRFGYGANVDFIHIINMDENKGWTGGINAGINYLKKMSGLSKYVLFLNDDIRIPDWHSGWLKNMVYILEAYDDVGAVGPTSNAVIHFQSLQYTGGPYNEVPVLSGFCFLTRAEIIDKIGLPDEKLPGGDDLDYSLRIRDENYKLICCRRVFIYHYYATTGKRLHPDWDSQQWSENINTELIKKHGLKKFLTLHQELPQTDWSMHTKFDTDKLAIQKIVPQNGGVILDMGCGSKKVYPDAIGIDKCSNGEFNASGLNKFVPLKGVDVVADVGQPLDFDDNYADYIVARHVLEHIVDYLKALKEWKRILKTGGKLVILVPDIRFMDPITCDPTHYHAFNSSSIINALEITGFDIEKQFFVDGGISLITVAVKN